MNIYIYNIIWIYWIYLNIFEYIEYLISPSLPSGRYCSAMSVSTSGGRWPVALWLFSQWEAPDEALMDAALQARSWIKHGSTWCNDLGELIVDDIYIYIGWCITVYHTELKMREITWSIGRPILSCTLTACFEASSGDWQQAVAFLDHVIHLQLSVLALACRVLEKTLKTKRCNDYNGS